MTPVLTSHPEKEKETEGERDREIQREREREREKERERETMPYCLIRVSLICSLKAYIFRNEPKREKKKKKKKKKLTRKTQISLIIYLV